MSIQASLHNYTAPLTTKDTLIESKETSPFVPVAPHIHHSFFEPDPIEVKKQESLKSPTVSNGLLDKMLHETQQALPPAFGDPKAYGEIIQFLNDHIHADYQETIYGTICPNRPNLIHPYPGSMPENPNKEVGVISQFMKHGLSKKFRETERKYNDALRHWHAQLGDHLKEVKELKNKDRLIGAYIEMLHDNPRQALNILSPSNDDPIDLERANLEFLAQFQLGNISRCLELKEVIHVHLPKTTLNDFGREILNKDAQKKLQFVYERACSTLAENLRMQEGQLPIERFYIQTLFQQHLEQACGELFNTHQGNFLTWISLYLVEESILEPAVPPDFLTEQMENNFPHVVRLFDKLEANLNLIRESELWDEYPLAKQYEDGTLSLTNKDGPNLFNFIDELSTPKSLGDRDKEREFVFNAIAIKLEEQIFEMLPHLAQR